MKRTVEWTLWLLLGACTGNGVSGGDELALRDAAAHGPDGGVSRTDEDSGPHPSCMATLPQTYQAESARRTEVQTESELDGYEGSGYVAGFDRVGGQLSFEVCAPSDGYYTVSFRYANAGDGVATRTLLVDGEPFAAVLEFPPQWREGAWTEGGTRALYLQAGSHQLALAYTSSDKQAMLVDAMTVSAGPSPSQVSVRSLLMNDWDDLVVGFHAAELYPADNNGFGPHMTALHSAIDWPTNQLDQAQAYLYDVTGDFPYDNPNRLASRMWFTASEQDGYGALLVEYGPYAGRALPVNVTRRQVVPPGGDIVLVMYTLENVSQEAREFALLEWADLHNKTAGPSEDPADTGERTEPSGALAATFHPESSAWIVDMTSTNGTALAVGAFSQVTRHVAGAPVSDGPDRSAQVVQGFFDDPSALTNSESFTGPDVGVGLEHVVQLAPGERAELAFFYAVTGSAEQARSLAAATRAGPPPEELAQAASRAWKRWLDSGAINALAPPEPAWRDAAETAMITIRQAQQPEFGSFVAATNPAYFYSVWPRDAAVTAMALDGAGYHEAAEHYWTWMAQAQADGSNPEYPQGTWWTNYGYWSPARGIPFVHPEWDSLGLFLTGVYHHHRLLGQSDEGAASTFLSSVWTAVRDAADFIEQGASDPANHGFGPEDFSIWEEDLAFHTFTQTTYVAGLRAAARLADARGSDGTPWEAAADSIRAAIFRPVSAEPCPGLWSQDDSYFIRSVKPDCTPDRRVDAATDLLWVLGVLSPDNPRAREHRDAILANLTPSEDWGFGISRYGGDTFYYSASFSPGGRYEALKPMPTWPQMSMYMTMIEHWLGMDDVSSNRLSWYVSTAPAGYVPHGEAVDWSTQRPLISTAAEPVTGAWFTLGLLNQLGRFDMRVPAAAGVSAQGEGE